MKKIILFIAILITSITYAQKPKADAIRFKEVTQVERDAMSVPPGEKWQLYNSTADRFEHYNGVSWVASDSGGGADGVVSNVVLNTTNLNFTGVDGGFNGSVDLSSLQDGTGTDDQTALEVNTSITGANYITDNTNVQTALTELDTAINTGDDTLVLTSTNTINFNAVIGHIGGINDYNSASNGIVTIQQNTTENIPVGNVLTYKQLGNGTLTVAYSGTASGDAGQTYYKGDVLSLWHKSLDVWEILNPPEPHWITIDISTSDLTTDLTTGTDLGFFVSTCDMVITEVRGVLLNAGTTTGMTRDLNVNGTSILSTKLTTDATENTSTTALTSYVLTTTDISDGDRLTVDHDVVPSGAKGSSLQLIAYKKSN